MKPHFQAHRLLVKALFLFLLSLAATAVYGQEVRKAINKPSPQYPELARKMNLSGTVRIQVTIAPNGQVKDTKVVGGHPLLAAAATSALQKWKFSPASVETSQTIAFDFRP